MLTCTAMDWKTFETEIAELAKKIDIRPDAIVGITRGGVVPARLLSSRLHVEPMHCISVEKRTRVLTEITADLENKTILLVEDAIETGKNLLIVKQYLETKGAVVKTACLYTSPLSQIVPDYFLRALDSVPRFPWE